MMKKVWICDICGNEIKRFNACETLEVSLTSESAYEKIFEGNVCAECLSKVKDAVHLHKVAQGRCFEVDTAFLVQKPLGCGSNGAKLNQINGMFRTYYPY